MKYLLDTHVVLWALQDSPNLSRDIRDIITSDENTIYVSVASLWEIAIKHSLGKIALDSKAISNLIARSGYLLLSIGYESINALSDIKINDNRMAHDPFDKMLVAQSKINNMTFLTHDHKMKYFNEPCIHVF